MVKEIGKKSAASDTAKTASKARSSALSAVETTRHSAENIVRVGTDAMKEFIAASAQETQRAQEKLFSFSRDSAQSWTSSADTAARSLNEAVNLAKDNIEACTECGDAASKVARIFNTESYAFANQLFSENVESSKEIFQCRTVNDFVEMQNKLFRTNVDAMFNQSLRFSELFFQFLTETAEPINERMADATERFSKSMAA